MKVLTPKAVIRNKKGNEYVPRAGFGFNPLVSIVAEQAMNRSQVD